MGEYQRAKRRITVSAGESVKIIRELQGMSKDKLVAVSGIQRSTISAVERGRINLGVERAKQLARALKCHPAVLVSPSEA